MSNEWINDKVQEVLLNALVIDKIEEVCDTPIKDVKFVHGIKNNEKVSFAVWFDAREEEWKFERRENSA